MEVSPTEIRHCASGIHAAGVGWGEGSSTLASSPAGLDAAGIGEVADILREVWGNFHPEAAELGDEVGYCLTETSVALHAVAQVYDDCEGVNAEMASRLSDILVSLGPV